MHSSSMIVALGALFTAIAAVPMKRDLIVDVVTEWDIVTEYATETVWVEGTSTWTVTVNQQYYTQPVAADALTTSTPIAPAVTQPKTTPPAPVIVPTAKSAPAVIVAPSPASTTSVYVAPPAPTTSAYVAPAAPTTPAYVAPVEPTTSVYVAPPVTTTTPAYVAPAPATTAAAPVATTAASSSGAQIRTGDITYYDTGLGSCGNYNTDSDMIVAVSSQIMDKPSMCGKTITISYNGQTHQATVADTCPGCAAGSLDLSPALFKAVAPNGDGRVHNVEWWFN